MGVRCGKSRLEGGIRGVVDVFRFCNTSRDGVELLIVLCINTQCSLQHIQLLLHTLSLLLATPDSALQSTDDAIYLLLLLSREGIDERGICRGLRFRLWLRAGFSSIGFRCGARLRDLSERFNIIGQFLFCFWGQ